MQLRPRVQRTVVINAVDEANSHLSVIVGHQDDVKQLLAVWIELPQPGVDVHQGLFSRGAGGGPRDRMLHHNVQTRTLANVHLDHQIASMKPNVSQKNKKKF